MPVVLFWDAWRIKAAHFPADVAVCGHNSKSEANRRPDGAFANLEHAMVATNDVRRELLARMDRATKQGRLHVEINAGEIHRVVGPDDNRHPMFGNTMRELLTAKDIEIHKPPSGNGPSCTVRYARSR